MITASRYSQKNALPTFPRKHLRTTTQAQHPRRAGPARPKRATHPIRLSSLAERIYGAHDVQKIVIDETAGLLVTVIGVPFRWPEVVAAFIAFRVLDMTKPWPIRWLDRNVRGGFGVVLDDLVAGAVACGALHGARLLHGGWW